MSPTVESRSLSGNLHPPLSTTDSLGLTANLMIDTPTTLNVKDAVVVPAKHTMAFKASNDLETDENTLLQRVKKLTNPSRSDDANQDAWVGCHSASARTGPPDQDLTHPIRSLFLSDLHLGSRFCKAGDVLAFLRNHRPEYLYLVGDIIDTWALRRRWYWPKVYDQLLDYVTELMEQGTKVFYAPGNHDSCLRRHPFTSTWLTLQDQFVHVCADGRRLIVLHGDQFDKVEGRWQRLSIVGSVAYDVLLFTDRSINSCLRRMGRRPKRISATAKRSVKLAVQFISKFESKIAKHAVDNECHGIVCGHIHVPRYRMLGEVLYVNLGDWIENSSALVEHHDGRLELLQ